jgi:hypothetical protein
MKIHVLQNRHYTGRFSNKEFTEYKPDVFTYELERRKLHNEELHKFYFSPSIIRIIKSRRMR